MKPTFHTTMSAATKATRAGNLGEATRLIQSALSGSPVPSETPSQSETSSSTIKSSRIDKSAETIEPDAPQSNPCADRRTWPLGQTIQALRKGRARMRPGPLGRKPRKTAADVSVASGAQFVSRSAPSSAGSIAYDLYIPSETPRGLIVMLHGCQQTSADFAIGTGMNAIAEENGFLVAYPQQTQAANAQGCWNWFEPRHQVRGGGEPEDIAAMTRALLAEYQLTDAFVAGLSAGGAMAAVMGDSYSELYKAIGIHSGLAPGSANDVMSAFAAMQGGAKAVPISLERVPAIVFQGSADSVVHASNADAILRAGGAGAPDAAPETSLIGGRSVLRAAYDAGRVESWRIEGGGHAWSGGQSQGSFTDPTGPDASREMMRFFVEHGRRLQAAQ